MTKFLETRVDKFTFKVATDLLYTSEGLWIKPEGDRVRVGLTDFVQQRNGDVAFANVRPFGTVLASGDELAEIETIKVTTTYTSPVNGKIVEVNPTMDSAPESINQDPYGAGWLARLEISDWEAQRLNLLDAQAYFELMEHKAEEEVKKP